MCDDFDVNGAKYDGFGICKQSVPHKMKVVTVTNKYIFGDTC